MVPIFVLILFRIERQIMDTMEARESDLHRKIILHKNVEMQDGKAQSMKGLDEKENFSFLKVHHDVVTITAFMKEILEVARTPHTPDELIRWVAESQSCSYESIYQPVYSFLKRMGRLGALVYEEDQVGNKPAVLVELEETKKLGDFTLLEQIGRSHKVVLYKCVRPEKGAHAYTIKILLRRNPRESQLKEFMQEFELLNFLPPHRNVRKCIEASVCDDIHYILFEHVDGRSMSSVVDKISLETKYSIAYQLMTAVDHLHRHQILHGDIHSSNFLIDPENNLHLIDLGMSHYEHEEEISHGGIPRYMPPERMPNDNLDFSKRKGDYQSEIFQIGICLYFLLSGNYPFNGLLLKDLANSIKHDAPPPLIKTPLEETIPQPIADIIFQSMEKEPSHRHQRVWDMLQAWSVAIRNTEWAVKEKEVTYHG
jgi:serine/threonine-protein kinase